MSGRRICKACNAERVKKYYSKEKRKAVLNSTCEACKSPFHAWRKKQVICGECFKESQKTGFKKNNYRSSPGYANCQHRFIAESVLGRSLSKNEVVHHVDEDPRNNELENLWVVSRHQHNKLHAFLRLQRVIYEKSLEKHSVNCWDTLRISQTKAWLEMTGAKVLKLVELGNQQPSP